MPKVPRCSKVMHAAQTTFVAYMCAWSSSGAAFLSFHKQEDPKASLCLKAATPKRCAGYSHGVLVTATLDPLSSD